METPETATTTSTTTPETTGALKVSAWPKVDLDTEGLRGGTLKTVHVRKPASGELRGLSLAQIAQLDVNDLRKVLPRLTIPPLTVQEIDALDPSDLVALGSEVTNFLLPKAARAAFPEASTT